VLLAAMLRAREIPSRVVAGLVYTESAGKPQMAYHMWTLAWIDGQWIALDATSGTLAPADRIAIASSNLADGNEYACLAPIIAAVGTMDIEITNAKYQPLK
jgi:transglutaminase-like putative cysteine protease